MSEPGQPGGDHGQDGMTRGAKRGFVVLAAAVLVTGIASTGASVAYANSTARRQDVIIAQLRAEEAQLRMQLLAGCAFDADIGGIPLPDKPRPSRLGVSIVVDSRAKWRANHCPGTLPVPPGLAKWAAVYKLPVN